MDKSNQSLCSSIVAMHKKAFGSAAEQYRAWQNYALEGEESFQHFAKHQESVSPDRACLVDYPSSLKEQQGSADQSVLQSNRDCAQQKVDDVLNSTKKTASTSLASAQALENNKPVDGYTKEEEGTIYCCLKCGNWYELSVYCCNRHVKPYFIEWWRDLSNEQTWNHKVKCGGVDFFYSDYESEKDFRYQPLYNRSWQEKIFLRDRIL